MKKPTEAMHPSVGRAIPELRRTRNWSQEELAARISKHGPRRGSWVEPPSARRISDWENGLRAPGADARVALARIARERKSTKDLAPIFLASTVVWRLVATVASLEDQEATDGTPEM
jgi:transcriptional regulator with XRE-family HTH domain